MARHFLGLYLLIVLTLTAGSWGQDKLLQAYGARDSSDDRALAGALSVVETRLQSAPASEWKHVVEEISTKTGAGLELFATTDIAGRETLDALKRGEIAYMQGATGEAWALKQLDNDYVLAFKSQATAPQRTPLEWMITSLFYAAMALVIMVWIWPLTRDLRALENAAARFGNKNWVFDARIKPRSQIYALAETFRKMAARIDGLIASHKDMSNAVSHEIKTPLSRMQFEIELAEQAQSVSEMKVALSNIKTDIAAINELVSATLNYAILERAGVSLNVGTHNFTALLPAITEYVRNDVRPDIRMCAALSGDTDDVICDLHLIETVVKNLLYNAARYARQVTWRSRFRTAKINWWSMMTARVSRKRIGKEYSTPYVQLEPPVDNKKGFGLGLAIVRWHGGKVFIAQSPLGGARICAAWPARIPTEG